MVVRSEGQGAESGGQGATELAELPNWRVQWRGTMGTGKWGWMPETSVAGLRTILTPGLGKPLIRAHSRLGEGHGDG